MTESVETLSSLVADCYNAGVTVRAFHARAVDPESNYQPSTHTIGRIAKGELVQMNPKLVGALAAALAAFAGVPKERVEAAATRQYIGRDITRREGPLAQPRATVTIVHTQGERVFDDEDMREIERIEREEFGH